MDNASTDGSADYVREAYPEVRLVASAHNLGIAEGNNEAVRHATGNYLFFLNNDAWLINPNAVDVLVQTAKHYPTAAVIGCQVLNEDGSVQDVGMKLDPLGFPIGVFPQTDSLPTIIDDIFYVTGCALFARADVFRALDGFDRRYFWSHEEADLAWRARLCGYTVLVDTRAVVGHVGGGIMIGGIPREGQRYLTTTTRIYHRERSTLATLLKDYSLSSLARVLPIYIGLNILEVAYFLFMLKPALSWQYVRAYWWNVRHLPGTVRARRCAQDARRVSDRDITRYFVPGPYKLALVRALGMPRVQS